MSPSKTPRVDAMAFSMNSSGWVILRSDAVKLEEDLNAVTAERDALRKLRRTVWTLMDQCSVCAALGGTLDWEGPLIRDIRKQLDETAPTSSS